MNATRLEAARLMLRAWRMSRRTGIDYDICLEAHLRHYMLHHRAVTAQIVIQEITDQRLKAVN